MERFARAVRRLAVACAALWLVACVQTPPASPAATAASRTPPPSMLWVGNSFYYYNNSMHNHVGIRPGCRAPDGRVARRWQRGREAEARERSPCGRVP